MNFCIGRDGSEVGEYPLAKVEQLARAGELLPTDFYWHDGMESWLVLGDLLGPEMWAKKKRHLIARPAPVSPMPSRRVRRNPAPQMPAPTVAALSPSPQAPEGPWLFIGAMICVALIWAIALLVGLANARNPERAAALQTMPASQR